MSAWMPSSEKHLSFLASPALPPPVSENNSCPPPAPSPEFKPYYGSRAWQFLFFFLSLVLAALGVTPAMRIESSSPHVAIGQMLELDCIVARLEQATVTWHKRGSALPASHQVQEETYSKGLWDSL